MAFRIVETTLDPSNPARVLTKAPLPQVFDAAADARAAMRDLIAGALRGGYDQSADTWWAHTVRGDILSYAIEQIGAAE